MLLRELVTAVAAGNLRIDIPLKAGDTTSICAAVARMQASLRQTVMAVRSDAEAVATASAQIAQGNLDLSSRTEQQASAIQQTSSTMEQLNAAVNQTAGNAREAEKMARRAADIAVAGGEAVNRFVETMHRVDTGAQRVGDIIGVIDGIAFQTNILALNAAVEAARAGEQGRGFAVVAAEVRSLAKRSSDAAKEVKGVIGASSSEIQAGTRLSDEARERMSEVVNAIGMVSSYVTDIAAASAQQATGVAQVGSAMSSMDQTTQQNAALVEQSAAAAESLRCQASHLQHTVALFELPQGPSALIKAGVSTPTTASRREGALRTGGVTEPASLGGPTKHLSEAAMNERSDGGDWTTF